MKLWDFYCPVCGLIVEYLQKSEDDIPVCCLPMQKIFTSCNVAVYKSGFKPKPLVDGEDRPIDPKKQDIFGRRWDELPDTFIKTRDYWRKIDDFEQTYRRKAPMEYRMDLINRLFRKEIQEKVEEVKDGGNDAE